MGAAQRLRIPLQFRRDHSALRPLRRFSERFFGFLGLLSHTEGRFASPLRDELQRNGRFFAAAERETRQSVHVAGFERVPPGLRVPHRHGRADRGSPRRSVPLPRAGQRGMLRAGGREAVRGQLQGLLAGGLADRCRRAARGDLQPAGAFHRVPGPAGEVGAEKRSDAEKRRAGLGGLRVRGVGRRVHQDGEPLDLLPAQAGSAEQAGGAVQGEAVPDGAVAGAQQQSQLQQHRGDPQTVRSEEGFHVDTATISTRRRTTRKPSRSTSRPSAFSSPPT